MLNNNNTKENLFSYCIENSLNLLHDYILNTETESILSRPVLNSLEDSINYTKSAVENQMTNNNNNNNNADEKNQILYKLNQLQNIIIEQKNKRLLS